MDHCTFHSHFRPGCAACNDYRSRRVTAQEEVLIPLNIDPFISETCDPPATDPAPDPPAFDGGDSGGGGAGGDF